VIDKSELTDKEIVLFKGMGRAFFRQNKPTNSLPYYGKAIQLNPKVGYVYNLLASSLLRLRQFDMAIEYFKEALKIDPNDVDAQDGVGKFVKGQPPIKKRDSLILCMSVWVMV
jgi:pentatricopeptide repeat protein